MAVVRSVADALAIVAEVQQHGRVVGAWEVIMSAPTASAWASRAPGVSGARARRPALRRRPWETEARSTRRSPRGRQAGRAPAHVHPAPWEIFLRQNTAVQAYAADDGLSAILLEGRATSPGAPRRLPAETIRSSSQR